MTEYLIYFNQQWVGDHPDDWWQTRVAPSVAVIHEMEAQGIVVFAGGLEEEDGPIAHGDATSGTTVVTDGPYAETTEWLGGLTIIDVPDFETARYWAGRIAEGCGWPQEVRQFKKRARPPVTSATWTAQARSLANHTSASALPL